jgi:ABC-type glycerol-3-phosphate transport system substrate-binding protein
MRVEYRRVVPFEKYEDELMSALAEGRGPDVFVIHHTWLIRRFRALLPAPEEQWPFKEFREAFPDVVVQDLAPSGRIYAAPLTVDTLALYYNRDRLNTAGIATPPRTWKEFAQAVQKLTKIDEYGEIRLPGAAFGAARNINRAPDLLSVLIMQAMAAGEGGSTPRQLMSDERTGTPRFQDSSRAREALRFYTDFTNPKLLTYTWNLKQDYSLDSFAEEEAAMMINYSYHRATLRAKNPRLRFGIAPLPQISENPRRPRVDYAGYWAWAVSRSTPFPKEAWDFVKSITSAESARLYLERTGNPPARRDLIKRVINDANVGVFARQALTATSWVQRDNRIVDRIFNEVIDEVVRGRIAPEEGIAQIADRIKAIQLPQ